MFKNKLRFDVTTPDSGKLRCKVRDKTVKVIRNPSVEECDATDDPLKNKSWLNTSLCFLVIE
jgi:hypothetical protein